MSFSKIAIWFLFVLILLCSVAVGCSCNDDDDDDDNDDDNDDNNDDNNDDDDNDSPTGHEYQVCDIGTYDWHGAKSHCEDLGGYLVTLSSEGENVAIIYLLDLARPGWLCSWIGLTDEGGSFEWITGEPLEYENWREGEPNGSGDYVQMYGSGEPDHYGKWDDTSASEPDVDVFVCEF